jgi:synaptic vesicle membrane protein VAT-1
MNANKAVFGVKLGHLWDEVEMIEGTLSELAGMWERGEIDPVIDSRYSFDEASRAHEQLGQARNFGKVVLTP